MSKYSWVFGFGSLVHLEKLQQFLQRPVGPQDFKLCTVQGYQRNWNVANNNLKNERRGKYYVDPQTEEQVPYYITYLNVTADPGSAINGLLFKVSEQELSIIDNREACYDRTEITEIITLDLEEPAWMYVGSAEAVARFELGKENDVAVISQGYLDTVLEGFGNWPGYLDEYLETTEKPEVPIIPLKRLDR